MENKGRGQISEAGKQIKILAEVEKIWILYDLDANGTLSFDELKIYLQEMSEGTLTDNDLLGKFKEIDQNDDNKITKAEMSVFIEKVMDNNTNFRFKSISELQS